MSSLKCAQCGLVNFATAIACKRCKQPLVVSSSAEGIVLSDGYVLPPPPNVGLPSSGVWRDKSKMIVTHDSALPDRFIKCNAPALGPRLRKKLTWHHPALYLLLLVALLIALIVTLILRKTMIVELGLCEEHMKTHRRNVLITWGLIGGGGACILLAAMAEEGAFVFGRNVVDGGRGNLCRRSSQNSYPHQDQRQFCLDKRHQHRLSECVTAVAWPLDRST